VSVVIDGSEASDSQAEFFQLELAKKFKNILFAIFPRLNSV
jgi:hypothetical protein